MCWLPNALLFPLAIVILCSLFLLLFPLSFLPTSLPCLAHQLTLFSPQRHTLHVTSISISSFLISCRRHVRSDTVITPTLFLRYVSSGTLRLFFLTLACLRRISSHVYFHRWCHVISSSHLLVITSHATHCSMSTTRIRWFQPPSHNHKRAHIHDVVSQAITQPHMFFIPTLSVWFLCFPYFCELMPVWMSQKCRHIVSVTVALHILSTFWASHFVQCMGIVFLYIEPYVCIGKENYSGITSQHASTKLDHIVRYSLDQIISLISLMLHCNRTYVALVPLAASALRPLPISMNSPKQCTLWVHYPHEEWI